MLQMNGKRVWISDFLFKTGLIFWIKKLYEHNSIVVLNYHRIRPSTPGASSEFDDNVFDVNVDGFALQMKWLKQHARILSEQDLIDVITTPGNNYSKLKTPLVAITFDDGYLDNYSLAYPVLKSLDIPAFFFVCTAMITERRLWWWDIVAFLIKKCKKSFIVMDNQRHDLLADRSAAIQFFQHALKKLSAVQIDQFVLNFSNVCEVALPSIDLQDRELMNWKQIREMASNQMTVASHTHTHPVLALMDKQEILEELMLSKQILETQTGQPVLSISYPFGDYCYIPSVIETIARNCGYNLGFTSNFGVNPLKQIQPLGLNRIAGHLGKKSTVSIISVLPHLFTRKNAAWNMIG
ncbi:MAG: polysaccharide deacetylase family protein [Pseudomonadota bacterium]